MNYYTNTCKCGCGGQIEIKKRHKYYGIPQFILGHNKNNLKHGETKTKLYQVWAEIKQRCNNPNDMHFKDYGGRGITICPEWTNDYIKFRDWALNNGYQEGLTIDRIENDGNYSPKNCQWISLEKNAQKKRTTKLNQEKVNEIRIKYNSGYYTQKQLAKEYNVSIATISLIINNKRWWD